MITKSNYIYELLKQSVSLRRIMARNAEDGRTFDILDSETKKLPFFLVKFQADSHINVLQSKDQT
jgi:hypothetical protein